MNKKILLALIALLIIGILLVLGGGGGRTALLGEGIAIYRTTIAEVPTSQGFMHIPFTGSSERYTVINIALDVNGDGAYAAYETTAGTQEEWIIMNEFPDISGMANRLPFTIIDPQFGTKPASGIAVISTELFEEDAWPAEIAAGETEEKAFTVAEVILEARDKNRENDPTGERATGFPALTFAETAHAQAAPPPAPAPVPAQQNAGPYARHETAYDQDQRYNECGPTSVTNSFRMLAKKYGLEDRIPAEPTDITDELKSDLDWNDGVRHDNMIKGKQSFINRHRLPFEAHQIGSKDDPELLKKIRDEIAKGQAVEAWIEFQNASGTIVGAHLVTVVGAGFQNGRNVITITDPDTASGGGGGSRDLYRVNPTNYMPQYGWDGVSAFLTYAYAQSPTQELIDRTWTDPFRTEAMTVGTGGRAPEVSGETRTRSRSKFGFFEVTAPHPGDHFVGESFTYEVAVDKRNIERTRQYRDAGGVLRTWRYGAGSPWVLNGVFRATGPLSPGESRDRPNNMEVRGTRATAAERFTCSAPGLASISYAIGIGWARTGGDVPAAILNGAHGAEFSENTDTMTVHSPPFRCLAKEGTPPPAESHASVLDSFCPGFTEDPNGAAVDVLRQGNECYPTLQFHQADPDKCDAKHWHANAGTARSLNGRTWTDPSGCGFGRISEVPAGKVKLAPDQAAPYIDNIPVFDTR